MNLELYFSPGACSFVPHALLETAGAAFEPKMLKLHKGEQQSEAYKALNPRGQVPLLVVDGQPINQIVAICQWIARQFPEQQFAPQDSFALAKFTETLAWMNNSVHPTFTHIFMPQKYTSDAAAQESLKAFNKQQFAIHLGEINAHLGAVKAKGGQWYAAAFGHDHFSALDAYALTFTRWGSIAGIDPLQWTHTWAHIERISQEPAIARVIERERLKLNMMAA